MVKKILLFIISSVVAFLIVNFTYKVDMNNKFKVISLEVLNTINYQTLSDTVSTLSAHSEIQEYLKGKSLEDKILEQVTVNQPLKRYFKDMKMDNDYYEGYGILSKDLENAVLETADFIYEFERNNPTVKVK